MANNRGNVYQLDKITDLHFIKRINSYRVIEPRIDFKYPIGTRRMKTLRISYLKVFYTFLCWQYYMRGVRAKRTIIDWNHFSRDLTDEEIRTLEEFYKYCDKKSWIFKK